jgi:cobalt-precorrin-6B (C15)-methyltransferase
MDWGNGMIKDQDFIKNPKVPGPTKEEIRCILMCKSDVSKTSVVVDIGCGTGGLTVEFAKRAGTVYAVDMNPIAIKTTIENIQKHEVDTNVEVIEGDGLYVLDELENIDILMIGGSKGKLSKIIKKGYEKLNKGGKILVTSILLETATEAISTFKNLSITPDVVNVAISRGKVTKAGTMIIANNPITIISVQKPLN